MAIFSGSEPSTASQRPRMPNLWSLLYILPVGFLALFFCYPLLTVLRIAFADGFGGLRALLDPYYLRVLWFTTWQALLSTGLTLLLALPAAYAFARYDFAGKSLLRAISSVPFVMPTVVVAAAFSALLGPRGVLNSALQWLTGASQPPIQIQGTIWLILLAHVFYNYTVVLRLVGGFWSNLDTRLEQAASVLGARRWRVWWEITLPLLMPSLAAAALLIFIFNFTSFGVVVLLGGPHFATLEVEVYRQVAQLLRLDIASALSLIQLVCTLVLTLVYTRMVARASVPLDLRPQAAQLRPVRIWGARLLVGANVSVMLLLLASPLLALVISSFSASDQPFRYYSELGTNRTGSIFYVAPAVAIRNSLMFGLATTVIALSIGTLAAYLLAQRDPQGAKRSPKRTMLGLFDALFMLPLGTSAVTLGLGFLVAFAEPPIAWRASAWIIPVVHALVAAPFVVRTLLPVLRGLDTRLRQAAAVLGASPWRVWREIDLPMLFPAMLVGAVFAFTASLGEFGATIMLARPEYPTLPLVIFRFLGQPGALNYGQALALSTILMLTTAISFLLLERIRYRDIGEF
jgi:thiamine transport system permease protein